MTSVSLMKTDTPVLDIWWPFLMQMVLDIWWPFLMQMVYQQVCILVGCVPPVRNCTVREVSLTEIPLHRDPLDRDSPSQTKNPLDRDPLDRDPLGQRPPGQRFPTPGQIPLWTETPLTKTPPVRSICGVKMPLRELPVVILWVTSYAQWKVQVKLSSSEVEHFNTNTNSNK